MLKAIIEGDSEYACSFSCFCFQTIELTDEICSSVVYDEYPAHGFRLCVSAQHSSTERSTSARIKAQCGAHAKVVLGVKA